MLFSLLVLHFTLLALNFSLSAFHFSLKSRTFASDYEKDTIRLFGKYLPLTYGRRSVQTVHNPERC